MTIDDKHLGGERETFSPTMERQRDQRSTTMEGPAPERLASLDIAEPPNEAPPAYGSEIDHFELSQPGLDAGAVVTGDGRVNININQKSRRLAELLAPVITAQTAAPASQPPAYQPSDVLARLGLDRPIRLNIVIQIVGSRGDVQPFVALGKVLKETHGHRVRIATHPTFQGFVEENGLEFFSIGGDPAELMAFMVKHPGLMPGLDAIKSGEIKKRREGVQGMLLGCWRSCIEGGNGLGPPPQSHGKFDTWDPMAALPGDGNQQPFVADAIIANPPSFAHIHIAEKLGIPLHMMFTMPWSPTKAFPHPLANIQSTNADDAMTNYLTYRLVEMMTWQGLGDVINRFREKALDLAPLEMIWAPGLMQRLKISYTYCWSPALIPKPNDWGQNIDVAGFYFLNLASSYSPDPSLAAFLGAGPPPVYIGFGSIVVDDPNAMTRLIFDAIHLAGVRALVSKGWGGLGADAVGLPQGVYMLGNVPHDWLFERVSCVVHHGGAGTTAAGIKAGKPTIVVPFFGDQPFWGAMISRAKAGPDPIPHTALTAEKLAEAIKFCLRPETQQQAMRLGEKIREERGAETGAQSFHQQLDLDKLRCSVNPSRAAAWRVRRSNVRLSPLAAAVLVDKGLVEYTDLKLYRSCEYITEGQPPEPITAGASSIMADLSSIGMSLFADLPRDMFRSRRQPDPSRPHESQAQSPEDSRATTPSLAGSRAATSTLSPPPIAEQHASSSSPRARSADRSAAQQPSISTSSVMTAATIDATMSASRGVGRAVVTGVKSPMNFCLGLAKGFRNLPRLYGDDTVREVEKVTDLSSGIKIASKELGLGFYDGVAGLVTQPMKGAQKDGVGGFVKGFGKGIGGLIAKPAAGIWGLPAYMMQGAYAEVNKYMARSALNYVMSSRVAQGRLDVEKASNEERMAVLTCWNMTLRPELKNYFEWKRKQAVAEKAPSGTDQSDVSRGGGVAGASSPPRRKEGWHRNDFLLEEGKKRLLQMTGYSDGVFAKHLGTSASPGLSTSTSTDQQYEEAIRTSVRETSRGNAEEDAVIENAIRQSVNAARQSGALPDPVPASKGSDNSSPNIFEDAEYQITDEEYQELVARATLESLASHAGASPTTQHPFEAEAGGSSSERVVDASHDADLERGIQESRDALPPLPPRRMTGEDDGDQEDEDLQRAIAASKVDMERSTKERTEEDIVMEYVKRQSLAEEQFRKHAMAPHKGKAPLVEENDDEEEDDDEDLRRAIEESLRLNQENGSS